MAIYWLMAYSTHGWSILPTSKRGGAAPTPSKNRMTKGISRIRKEIKKASRQTVTATSPDSHSMAIQTSPPPPPPQMAGPTLRRWYSNWKMFNPTMIPQPRGCQSRLDDEGTRHPSASIVAPWLLIVLVPTSRAMTLSGHEAGARSKTATRERTRVRKREWGRDRERLAVTWSDLGREIGGAQTTRRLGPGTIWRVPREPFPSHIPVTRSRLTRRWGQP